MQGQASPSSRTTRASTWVPWAHCHPAAATLACARTRISIWHQPSLSHSSPPLIRRYHVPSQFTLPAVAEGSLGRACGCGAHPQPSSPCARRQLISFAPRRYESARYFVLRLWVSNDALHRGPNSFQAGVEGRSLDNPGLGTCCVRGCPGG